MLRKALAVEACFASTSLVGYTLTHFTTHLHFPDPPLWDPAPARRLRLSRAAPAPVHSGATSATLRSIRHIWH